MAIKTLKYTVGDSGITPAFERNAGVQYDHKKTQLEFVLEDEFYDSVISEIKSGTVSYRFDCYDGEGGLHQSDYYPLSTKKIEPYVLEYWVTKFGGKIKVCFIITISSDEQTQAEFYNETVVVNLKDLPENADDTKNYKSVTTLAQAVKNNAKTATNAMQEAKSTLYEIEKIRVMLENAEWVFDGNQGEIDVDFAVESDFDVNSKNALANSSITKRFDEVDKSLKSLKEGFAWQTIDELLLALRDQIFLEAHPVGSLYWSMSPTSPETLFGGKWEQITDVFIFAAGERTAGTTGGEATHPLTVNEMPSHTHMFNPSAQVDGIDFVVPTNSGGTGISSISINGTAHHPGHWATTTWGTYSTGGGKAHNNMPPYMVAYCWKRINDEEE